MSKFKYTKRISLKLVILSLFITISLLTSAQFVRANESAAIPGQFGLDYFLLLENQSVSSSVALTSSSGNHTVGITSIGNNKLSASISIFVPSTEAGTEATGFWWLLILGTGGKYWSDLKFGIIPVTGPTVAVDIGKVFSFGLVIGGIILDSPVSVEDPVTYTISVSGTRN